MNERDELVEDFRRFLAANYPCTCEAGTDCDAEREEAEALVKTVEIRGYRKPRTITTAEELDALPNGSVIRTAGTDEYEPRVVVKLSNWNDSAEWDVADCEELSVMTGELDDLPATVLWEPK